MNPWIINPSWQNFCSLYREAITAQEAKTGMEQAHHLTASLYFGTAALEAFLNNKMRVYSEATKSEEEIFTLLRTEKMISKLKKWPADLLGKPLNLNNRTLDLITFFNDVRGNLTHPKTYGHDIYAKLETVDPISVIASVAEYIVRFHEVEATRFPYWLFGWNYLNPRLDSYEISILNDRCPCELPSARQPTVLFLAPGAWFPGITRGRSVATPVSGNLRRIRSPKARS